MIEYNNTGSDWMVTLVKASRNIKGKVNRFTVGYLLSGTILRLFPNFDVTDRFNIDYEILNSRTLEYWLVEVDFAGQKYVTTRNFWKRNGQDMGNNKQNRRFLSLHMSNFDIGKAIRADMLFAEKQLNLFDNKRTG